MSKNSFKVTKSATAPRAFKACQACRKLKTRCFPSDLLTACSRCWSLQVVCSFEEDAVAKGTFASVQEIRELESSSKSNQNFISRPTADSEWSKLNQIHEDVKKLVRLLTAETPSRQMPPSVLAKDNVNYDTWNGSESESQQNVSTMEKGGLVEPKIVSPSTMVSTAFLTSPFNVLKESPHGALLPFLIQTLLTPQPRTVEKDIVSLKIITKAECYLLLNIFRDKYGKWISLKPDVTTEELLSEYCKESPLLLDVCCLVALRSLKNHSLKKRITKLLTQRISNSLAKQLLGTTSTELKFIATLTLLLVYGYTLSLPTDFHIDPWFYSGLALKHFITLINYNPSFINATISFLPDASSQFDLLTYMRIYDHLLVTHLFNCIVSGRTSLIDRVRLNTIRSKLDIVFAGIFDGKMTAEVYLCDIVYDYFVHDMKVGQNAQANALDLFRKVVKKLDHWYASWSYLITQPIPQLLEFLFNFYTLLIYYHVNFQLHYDELNQGILYADPESEEFAFSRNPNFQTFSDVLALCEPEFLDKMMFNCLKVVNEIISFISRSNLDNIIDNSEQFEYISDQIHFSLFFGIVALVRLIKNSFNSSSNSEEITQQYVDYFNDNFEPFDIHGNLKPLIMKSEQILLNLPLHRVTERAFVSYLTSILIIVKKYQIVANDISGDFTGGRPEQDTNNAFYRYYHSLKVIILKAFPGLNIDYLFE